MRAICGDENGIALNGKLFDGITVSIPFCKGIRGADGPVILYIAIDKSKVRSGIS